MENLEMSRVEARDPFGRGGPAHAPKRENLNWVAYLSATS